MRGILEFELPQEREDFETAQKGINYKIALQEFSEFLRKKLKHEELRESVSESAIYEEVREKFYEFLRDEDVNI